jgi:phage shock protein A
MSHVHVECTYKGRPVRQAIREVILASKEAKVKPKSHFVLSREKRYMDLQQKLHYAQLDAKHWRIMATEQAKRAQRLLNKLRPQVSAGWSEEFEELDQLVRWLD